MERIKVTKKLNIKFEHTCDGGTFKIKVTSYTVADINSVLCLGDIVRFNITDPETNKTYRTKLYDPGAFNYYTQEIYHDKIVKAIKKDLDDYFNK